MTKKQSLEFKAAHVLCGAAPWSRCYDTVLGFMFVGSEIAA